MVKFVIDYSPLPDFYGRHISTNIYFLFTPQQSPSFFILVEVTVNGLCLIFYRAVFLSCENLPVHGPLLAKTVCKTLMTSHSVWTLDSDHLRPSRALVTPLDDVNRASILKSHTPLDQSKRAFYTVHCVKSNRTKNRTVPSVLPTLKTSSCDTTQTIVKAK